MLLSVSILAFRFWIVQGGDDVVQVVQHLTVHLGQTSLTSGLRRR